MKKIMVRIRGLGRALGRVSDRGLGRERRPTAFVRRQRVPVTVANAEPVVPAVEADVVANEPMVEADVQDIGADTGA
ncbi:hypothetical protein HKD37_13G038786 [Glycine soja]